MTWHIWLPLSGACLAGVLWRFFSRASKAYRSKLRAYPSRRAFMEANWDVFLLRTFPWNAGAFALWLLHPDYAARLLIFAHVPAAMANWIIVTPNLLSSAFFGFVVDYGLDQLQLKLAGMNLPAWFPESLKGEIPQYDQQVVNSAALAPKSSRDTGTGTVVKNAPSGGGN